jgi:hypothetical protein
MNTIRTRTKRRGLKMAGAVLAGAAVVGAGALTVALDRGDSEHASTLAGSGDGSSGGMYTQPSIAGMTMGATASAPATPASTPEVADAKPAIKAG